MRGRVVSLEPAPAEYGSLVRNLALNASLPVRAVQAAASDSTGYLTFLYNPDRPTQGKLQSVETTYVNEGAQTIEVESLPLDRLLGSEPPPDVMKVDIEGAAAGALRGAGQILDEARPAVYIELHGPEEQAGIYDELLGRGYVAETLGGERVSDPRAAWHGALWCTHPDGKVSWET